SCFILPAHLQIRPTQISTIFPYTTLFRSIKKLMDKFLYPNSLVIPPKIFFPLKEITVRSSLSNLPSSLTSTTRYRPVSGSIPSRSEEHTSELQSRENLVCRLLLEKKKSIS